jgi:CheY-like chemotaxis protein
MKKILVIEDEGETRNMLLESLEAEGFEVLDAENGRIGIQKLQEVLPDLVICDIIMPELDGYGVLTALLQNPVTAEIPFIFLSAKTAEEERYYGIELGANDYLTKPCTTENLLEAIAKVIDSN